MNDLVNSAIARNAWLEVIEQMSAELRLSLMREALCAATALEKSESDEDSVLLFSGEEMSFGVLAGYFEECWWGGFVLLKSDTNAPTAEFAPRVQEHLRKKGVNVALKSEHYAFVELCECEEFSEFLPKMSQKLQENSALLGKLNDALRDFKV